eukprot:CAMPEP_0181048272 /NCGR_PEP_ID=MMETSP1070-20121207/15345_1 /TAXON_ID=265543 /ORGANISM="Minutocellus polymorphus, Strain NH13" /LENGTH=681 /DNA_ID=CAMNT_0023127041 /DNA_START=179 /DNA_END=2224 /DNA_ORIENTATION=+
MATTHHGMRRILKRRPAVVDYIRQSVETGVFQDLEANNPNNRRNNRFQQQQQSQFGAGVHPYPKYYEILSLNPPIPQPPKITKNLRRERSQMHLPTDRLIKSYLKRHDQRVRSSHPPTEAELEEARYAKLLGLSPPSSSDAMGRKSTVMANAYTFALKQYDLLRTDEAQGGDMTEEDSIEEVEKLLAEEAERERLRSRRTAEEAAKWRTGVDAAAKAEAEEQARASASSDEPVMLANDDDVEPPSAASSASAAAASAVPSILTGKPRALWAMNTWSKRLAAVPYNRWTVGAAAALDHWIAVDVLGLSEESWDKILAGDDGEDDEVMMGRGEGGTGIGIGSAARAKDVVAVRMALFPETVMFGDDEEESDLASAHDELSADDDDDAAAAAATQKSIDDLLASLSDLGDDDDEFNFGSSSESESTADAASSVDVVDEDLDERVAEMVDALQEWRQKNLEVPYAQWDEGDMAEFDEWLSDYVELVTTESDGKVDMAATREALLAEPPMKRDESDAFWSNVRDEAQVEIFLQNLREKASLESDESLATFLQLPHDIQVRRLVDLGTLRPLFDEYTSESERLAFLRRYADVLLEGTEVEHLVSDPKGPISADDLGSDPTLIEESDKGKRFRVEKIKYGTDEFGTARSQRARLLYRAWNEHKAGRARYEEAMFKKGKLGLEQKPKKQ